MQVFFPGAAEGDWRSTELKDDKERSTRRHGLLSDASIREITATFNEENM